MHVVVMVLHVVMTRFSHCREYLAAKREVDQLKEQQETLRAQRDVSVEITVKYMHSAAPMKHNFRLTNCFKTLFSSFVRMSRPL